MTVGELIEKLKSFDRHLEVVGSSGYGVAGLRLIDEDREYPLSRERHHVRFVELDIPDSP